MSKYNYINTGHDVVEECAQVSAMSGILDSINLLHSRTRMISDVADRTFGPLPQADCKGSIAGGGMVSELLAALDAFAATLSNAERICSIA